MPKRAGDAKAGLGTSIVQALAQQLQANITVTDANPGTLVSIIHTPIAAIHRNAAATASMGRAV
jgi:two-component sensor histidine kinase